MAQRRAGSTLKVIKSLPDQAYLLNNLQQVCLPDDTPYDTSEGYWWMVWDVSSPEPFPVAFAGLVRSANWFNCGYLCRAGVIPSYRGLGLQRRLIRVRERKARALGWQWLVSDTIENPHSSNNLIACGFQLYAPSKPWGNPNALYWRKYLKPRRQ